MEQQTLKNCWSKGKGAINAWCSIPCAVTAEMMSMSDLTQSQLICNMD